MTDKQKLEEDIKTIRNALDMREPEDMDRLDHRALEALSRIEAALTPCEGEDICKKNPPLRINEAGDVEVVIPPDVLRDIVKRLEGEKKPIPEKHEDHVGYNAALDRAIVIVKEVGGV